MGIVYLAEQKEHIRRRVALKLIKPGRWARLETVLPPRSAIRLRNAVGQEAQGIEGS